MSACSIEVSCPAKVNLTLAILGKRADGFHALHSIVAQTDFGDDLYLEWDPDRKGEDSVSISGLELPTQDNSVYAAIQLFREASGFFEGVFQARLTKRVPAGAGLGGGSSDGVAALKAIRSLMGTALPLLDWTDLAARLGSDCPLFLEDKAVLIEGRGEQVSALDPLLIKRLKGAPVILFKPAFSINTAEAYRRLAANKIYSSKELAAKRLSKWEQGDALLPSPHNDFEAVIEAWIPSLGGVLKRLRDQHGMDARLSGSGSACFVFANNPTSAIKILHEELAYAWGTHFWLQEACLK